MCPYSQFFWSALSRIWTEFEDLQSKSLYSVRMRENTDQKNSKDEHFPRSVCFTKISNKIPQIVSKITSDDHYLRISHVTHKRLFCGDIARY